MELDWIISASSPSIRLERVTAIWTLKEAYSKAIGEGLHFNYQRIQFSPGDDALDSDSKQSFSASLDGTLLSDWTFTLLRHDNSYLISTAYNRAQESNEDSERSGSRMRTLHIEDIEAMFEIKQEAIA